MSIAELGTTDSTTVAPGRSKLAGAPWEEVTVGEVMHPGVIVCSPGTPIRHAAWLMGTHRIHAVVVLGEDEEGGLWGVVADKDILAAAARGDVGESPVSTVTRTPIVSVARSDGIDRARAVMQEHGVSHLLVTTRGHPVGIISTFDLVRAVAAGVGAAASKSKGRP
jgi:CBS domain-containing protein